MDAPLLTSSGFWNDLTPPLAEVPELAGHVLFETSGSSGEPKWVALSKGAILASAAAVNRHLCVTPESSWGLVLPLNHVGGFGVAARAYEAGCRLRQFDPRWEPAAFCEWLTRNKVTHTSLVPTQVHDLVKGCLAAPGTLTAVVVGGGHLNPETGQAARDLGWPVLASYGMTEAATQIATQGLDKLQAPYQSVPLPLLPIWQARVSPEGLLCISGPALFSGYVSHGVFTARGTEWHTTSDQALLENGGITPLGRADTLVKILGELVNPEAVERELISLSRGALAPGTFAVIAIPDARAGHALIPIFEATVNPSAVEAACSLYQNCAPGFRRLQLPVVMETLPRTELGKLRKGELTAIYLKKITG